MTKPKVSVCIQTYQHAPYIRDAIESALEQRTDFPWELIIGDDGSTDGTQDICREYADKHDNIRLFLRERDGSHYARGKPTGRRNLLENLKQARGEYIALLDGDDYWTSPDKLQVQCDILDSHPDIIGCHHWYTLSWENGGRGPTHTDYGKPGRAVTGARELFSNEARVNLRTLMFRNILSDDFFPRWFNRVAYGDLPMMFLLARHGDFYFIDRPMAVYRVTGTGVSGNGSQHRKTFKGIAELCFNLLEIWWLADRLYGGQFRTEARQATRWYVRRMLTQYRTWLKERFA